MPPKKERVLCGSKGQLNGMRSAVSRQLQAPRAVGTRSAWGDRIEAVTLNRDCLITDG